MMPYFPIMEDARTQFFISVGYPIHITRTMPYILTDAAIVYEKQGRYGQTLKVEIAVTDLADKGCDLVYRISDADDGTEIVRAKTGILFFDYEAQKVMRVPDDFRNRFST